MITTGDMEMIMAKKVKFGFGKRTKRMKAGDKRRENEQAETHSHPGNKGSGDVTSRMAMALLCASAGLRVVPLHGVKEGLCTCRNEHCEQPGRHPRTENGLQDVTTDPEEVKQMWRRWPKAKAGIALGTTSRVLALVSEGATGKESLRKLLEHNEALKKTVTIRHGECLTRLFRTPEGCTVHHHELGHGLTILGDGDLVMMPSRTGIAKPGFLKGGAVGKVKIAEAPKWLIDQCARQVARVLKTADIKIADIVIGKNRRSLNPEKVTEIAESIATIGQTTAITVRRTEDGKLILVDGLHRLRATASLGWTHIRAEIMEGDDIEARLWEIAGLLHRADDLPALEEAERLAEWVRLTEGREPVSGQKVQKPKGGRPQSGVAKAARQLPVKGKTQEARRKRIERAIKIAAISSEAKAAIRRAGLDEHHAALCQIADQKDRKAQVAKVKEIAARKAGARQRLTRGTKKRTSKAKQAVPTATIAAGEPIDIPAGGSPPTVPEIGADHTTAGEIEQLKAELAEKTENLREAQEELQQARRAAARAPERAATSSLSPGASDDDLEIPAALNRRPLSVEDQAMLTSLISAWSNAPELQRLVAKASAVVRERFIAEILRGNRQGNPERHV
jgi:ParB/RepB/Spo0J family partition protein